MDEESMTPAPTDFPKPRPRKGSQDASSRQLRKARHRLRGDDDFDGDEGLLGRLAALVPQAVDVELQGTLRAIGGLAAGPTIDVATGNFGDRRDETTVRLALDRHDVSELPLSRCHDPKIG
jgi:hypothetical protein